MYSIAQFIGIENIFSSNCELSTSHRLYMCIRMSGLLFIFFTRLCRVVTEVYYHKSETLVSQYSGPIVRNVNESILINVDALGMEVVLLSNLGHKLSGEGKH